MDSLEQAQKQAMYMLASRMYTCREIYDKLLRKGHSTAVAEEAVTALAAVGYLDDAKYAALYLHDAVELGAKGVYRIRQELLRKGISRSVIDQAVAEMEVSPRARLQEYVEERLRIHPVTSRREYERLRAQLARRGYSPDKIRDCLAQFSFVFEEEGFE